MKELILKKFDTWKPDKLYTVSPDEKYLKGFAAPPFASGSEQETRRIKELLLKKFDLAEIKAAAEKAAAEKAAAEKAAAEKAAAEKAAAEKAAAEKAAAEKAAAEKAAAEKAAAEKAAAEKAAAEKAAAEKAAAEKAAAEKAAAEKAAAEKAAAEKAAAEKAAAEKAAAEKAAAEKAAAEKAAAEKAAAEKAAAEKAAAEKAAAEKAAAEKAAAEKAAAEKAAAEKAAAEKAAAEKAAAEKAAAEKAAEPEVSVSYEPPVDSDTTLSDPMEKAMKYLVAAVVVLVAIIVGSSMINKTKYYMDAKQGALEIWQGRFAPMGEDLLITLPGVQLPETIKDVYSKKDVFPLISNYYVEKADTLLEVPGMPDFEGIKSYLNKALSFAVTSASTEAAYNRLNNIELMILFYKADVAAGKATISDLKDAKYYLDQATALSTNDLQADMINQKIDAVDKQIATLKAKEEGAKSPTPKTPAK
jgi:chemotaxis protein histidine kinase CheA